jgi:hypothetical protein
MAVQNTQLMRASDARLDWRLRQFCREDVAKLCREAQYAGGLDKSLMLDDWNAPPTAGKLRVATVDAWQLFLLALHRGCAVEACEFHAALNERPHLPAPPVPSYKDLQGAHCLAAEESANIFSVPSLLLLLLLLNICTNLVAVLHSSCQQTSQYCNPAPHHCVSAGMNVTMCLRRKWQAISSESCKVHVRHLAAAAFANTILDAPLLLLLLPLKFCTDLAAVMHPRCQPTTPLLFKSMCHCRHERHDVPAPQLPGYNLRGMV